MAKTAKADQAPYVPTERERLAAQRFLERRARTAPAPRFKLEATGNKVSISADHPEPAVGHTLLADAFGTGDYEFAHGLLTQLTDVSRSGKVATHQELNFIAVCCARHQSQGRDRSPAVGTDGSDP